MFVVVFMFLIVPSFVFSQTSRQDSLWKPLTFFVGVWKGTGTGEPGNGVYERTYQRILNGKFIEVKNQSSYPPTEKFPQGEVHNDIGYMSYDKQRKKFVLRQFHVEGFVNQFTLDTVSADGNRMIFVSESIENIPAGWRAKETYQIVNDNEFIETFELAEPGRDFEMYTTVTLKRAD